MTIRTHTYAAHTADTCTVTGTGHIHRSGYVRASGADRYVSTHTAPAGRTYVVRTEHGIPGAANDAHGVWCVPTYTDAHGNALADRYGMPVVDMDGTTAYVATADGMGYASTGTGTYGAPTVPATADTPTYDADRTGDARTNVHTRAHAAGMHRADTDTYAAPTAPVCMACGDAATYLRDVPDGTTVTVHVHGGDGSGNTVTHTYTGTVERDTIYVDAIPHTVVYVTYAGGSWTTPRTDYVCHVHTDDAPTATDTTHDRHGDPIAHVDAEGNEVTMESGEIVAQGNERDYRGWVTHADGTYTAYDASGWVHYTADDTVIHAHTYGPVAGTDTTDDDTYVTVFGRPVRAHVAASMGVVDPAPWSGPIPGHTYTGTSRRGTDYTMFYDGTITTRTYADGTVTRADINHMWTTGTDGRTVTYVVAEGTYWRSDAEGNYDRVSSASWPMVATCGHDFGAYGACIAPVGHPHAEHIDANGNKFTGTAHGYDARTYGPTHPTTYTRVVTRVPMHRDIYRTVLRPDVAALVADYRATWAAWVGESFPTVGYAYAALVANIELGTYEPAPEHYAAWAATLDAHYGI